MAIIATSNFPLTFGGSKMSESQTVGQLRYYLTFLLDGFKTSAESVVVEAIFTIADRVPEDSCRINVLSRIEHLEIFKELHKLRGKVGPLLLISEEEPWIPLKEKALIELGALPSEDDIKHVLASVVEQVRQDNLVKQMNKGEALRKIKSVLDKYGGPITEVITFFS